MSGSQSLASSPLSRNAETATKPGQVEPANRRRRIADLARVPVDVSPPDLRMGTDARKRQAEKFDRREFELHPAPQIAVTQVRATPVISPLSKVQACADRPSGTAHL